MELIGFLIFCFIIVAIVIVARRFFFEHPPLFQAPIPTRKQALADWKRLNAEWMDEWEREWRAQTGETRPYGLALPKGFSSEFGKYLVERYSAEVVNHTYIMPPSKAQPSAPIPLPLPAQPPLPSLPQYPQQTAEVLAAMKTHLRDSPDSDLSAFQRASRESPAASLRYQSARSEPIEARYSLQGSRPVAKQRPMAQAGQDPQHSRLHSILFD